MPKVTASHMPSNSRRPVEDRFLAIARSIAGAQNSQPSTAASVAVPPAVNPAVEIGPPQPTPKSVKAATVGKANVSQDDTVAPVAGPSTQSAVKSNKRKRTKDEVQQESAPDKTDGPDPKTTKGKTRKAAPALVAVTSEPVELEGPGRNDPAPVTTPTAEDAAAERIRRRKERKEKKRQARKEEKRALAASPQAGASGSNSTQPTAEPVKPVSPQKKVVQPALADAEVEPRDKKARKEAKKKEKKRLKEAGKASSVIKASQNTTFNGVEPGPSQDAKGKGKEKEPARAATPPPAPSPALNKLAVGPKKRARRTTQTTSDSASPAVTVPVPALAKSKKRRHSEIAPDTALEANASRSVPVQTSPQRPPSPAKKRGRPPKQRPEGPASAPTAAAVSSNVPSPVKKKRKLTAVNGAARPKSATAAAAAAAAAPATDADVLDPFYTTIVQSLQHANPAAFASPYGDAMKTVLQAFLLQFRGTGDRDVESGPVYDVVKDLCRKGLGGKLERMVQSARRDVEGEVLGLGGRAVAPAGPSVATANGLPQIQDSTFEEDNTDDEQVESNKADERQKEAELVARKLEAKAAKRARQQAKRLEQEQDAQSGADVALAPAAPAASAPSAVATSAEADETDKAGPSSPDKISRRLRNRLGKREKAKLRGMTSGESSRQSSVPLPPSQPPSPGPDRQADTLSAKSALPVVNGREGQGAQQPPIEDDRSPSRLNGLLPAVELGVPVKPQDEIVEDSTNEDVEMVDGDLSAPAVAAPSTPPISRARRQSSDIPPTSDTDAEEIAALLSPRKTIVPIADETASTPTAAPAANLVEQVDGAAEDSSDDDMGGPTSAQTTIRPQDIPLPPSPSPEIEMASPPKPLQTIGQDDDSSSSSSSDSEDDTDDDGNTPRPALDPKRKRKSLYAITADAFGTPGSARRRPRVSLTKTEPTGSTLKNPAAVVDNDDEIDQLFSQSQPAPTSAQILQDVEQRGEAGIDDDGSGSDRSSPPPDSHEPTPPPPAKSPKTKRKAIASDDEDVPTDEGEEVDIAGRRSSDMVAGASQPAPNGVDEPAAEPTSKDLPPELTQPQKRGPLPRLSEIASAASSQTGSLAFEIDPADLESQTQDAFVEMRFDAKEGRAGSTPLFRPEDESQIQASSSRTQEDADEDQLISSQMLPPAAATQEPVGAEPSVAQISVNPPSDDDPVMGQAQPSPVANVNPPPSPRRLTRAAVRARSGSPAPESPAVARAPASPKTERAKSIEQKKNILATRLFAKPQLSPVKPGDVHLPPLSTLERVRPSPARLPFAPPTKTPRKSAAAGGSPANNRLGAKRASSMSSLSQLDSNLASASKSPRKKASAAKTTSAAASPSASAPAASTKTTGGTKRGTKLWMSQGAGDDDDDEDDDGDSGSDAEPSKKAGPSSSVAKARPTPRKKSAALWQA